MDVVPMIVYKRKNVTENRKNITVAVNAGHGTSGANLRVALILRKLLLDGGYDVLMIREEQDVQLDNIARTVISNNNADIHISIHFDGDSKKTDKGCFYCGIPEELKFLENVNNHYAQSETLGTQCTVPNTNLLEARALGIFKGIEKYFD